VISRGAHYGYTLCILCCSWSFASRWFSVDLPYYLRYKVPCTPRKTKTQKPKPLHSSIFHIHRAPAAFSSAFRAPMRTTLLKLYRIIEPIFPLLDDPHDRLSSVTMNSSSTSLQPQPPITALKVLVLCWFSALSLLSL
jgi:hypothetical protein